MSASIFSLATRRPQEAPTNRDWTAQEAAELYRVCHLLNEAGFSVAVHVGLSDEGEPWAVFERQDTCEVVVHVARTGGMLVVVNVQTRQVYRGRDFRAITDEMLRDTPMPLRYARAQGKVVLHPSAIFSAFLAAAVGTSVFLHSTGDGKAAETTPADSRDGQALLSLISRALPREGATGQGLARYGSVGALAAAFLIFDLPNSSKPGVLAEVEATIAALTKSKATSTVDSFESTLDLSGASTPQAHAPEAAQSAVLEMTGQFTGQFHATLEAALKLLAAVGAAVATAVQAPQPAVVAAVDHPVAVAEAKQVTAEKDTHRSTPDTTPADDLPKFDPSISKTDVTGIMNSVVSFGTFNIQPLPATEQHTVSLISSTMAFEPGDFAAISGEAGGTTTITPVEGGGTIVAEPTTGVPAAPVIDYLGHLLYFHQARDVSHFEDGRADVYVHDGRDARIDNFRLGEDYIAVDGNWTHTGWIQEIVLAGNDVKIIGVDGSTLTLDGVLGHTT